MEARMTPKRKPADRRYFIGGSDARIVMGDDEAALLRLWRQKPRRGRARRPLRESHRPTRRPYRGALTAAGMKPIRARSLLTSSWQSDTRQSGGWRRRSTG